MAMPSIAAENVNKPMTDKQKAYIEKMVSIGKRRLLSLPKPPNYPDITRKEASELIDYLQARVFPDDGGKAKRKEIRARVIESVESQNTDNVVEEPKLKFTFAKGISKKEE